MHTLLTNLKININEKIYLKDPESSALGKRIVENSILLIDEIGFDAYTFKKLGAKIGSNESSIYRYFESKHKLLIYLASWYWTWLEYQLVFTTNSIENTTEKIERAITILTRTTTVDSNFSHINEVILKRIVINEYSKSYLTKEVDNENKDGYFLVYKRLVKRLHDMILAIDSNYPYAYSLSSTVIDGALHQHFLKDHFTTISDLKKEEAPTNYFKDLVFKSLNISTNE
ncbi:TetR/AcrR family transcriptional regulator [Olleya sp. HaHaR_3_96]|uniref:TetR/AcrR family transcriptional regulator n=1 Tax=Olleya sp. HaHaR_3_96 TaxID=2745560 RepID=UPI001C4F6C45|nr:TetR/AcrR family transcriptional regulator [Olleya sp. HaHaR_3_96]QXP58714.1 TetR/AcrR family transcriptional regulator [Olleya sp. HaHaR_3_96]